MATYVGSGAVMAGVASRGGITRWINISTKGCHAVAGSIHCRSRSFRYNQTYCRGKARISEL